MMHMTFYWGIDATLLFDQWVTKTLSQYLMSLLAIVLFGILHEWLISLRLVVATKKNPPPHRPRDPENTVPLLQKIYVPENQAWKDAIVALLYGINAGTGFLLMLLVMSFNGGVLIAVVVGLALGFSLFRTKIYNDPNLVGPEVCH